MVIFFFALVLVAEPTKILAQDDTAALKAQLERVAKENAELRVRVADLENQLARLQVPGNAPTTRPVQSLADVRTNYQSREKAAGITLDAAKQAYAASMAKADAEALAALKVLQHRAMLAEDLDGANKIQAAISDIQHRAAAANDPSSTRSNGGPEQGRFFDDSGNKVVFLCQKSGSMLSVFGNLKQQMKASLSELDSAKQFNIVFFSDEGADPLFKDGLRSASDDNKAKAMSYIDNEVAAGGCLPLPAIRFALKERPDSLFVLSDGFDETPSTNDIANAFKSNAETRINCIFLQSDEDPKLELFMKRIADQGHGTFKKIAKSDM